MSASEKLKGLKGRTYLTIPIPGSEQMATLHKDALWDALPQIVAVVEAAETYAADLGSVEAGEVPSECEELDAALTALEEALS